jgi:hypothetical protein
MNREELAARYALLDESDLIALARTYDSLTDLAQTALRDEFTRRKLDPPIIEEPEPPPTRLVTIERYRDLSEAIVARSLLEASGIPVHLADENLVRLDWQISNFIGGIRLQVAAEDETDATELLRQPIPPSIAFSDDIDFAQPQCPRCGSLDITFDGSSRKAALASLYILALPLPLGPQTWSCNACNLRWQDSEPA